MTLLTFGIIFLAVITALLVSPVSSRLARSLRLVDMPGSAPHKLHLAPTLLAGGISIFLTVFAVTLLLPWLSRGLVETEVWSILAAGSLVFLLGLVDDARSLPPWLKLAGQVVATGVLVWLGVRVRLFENLWLDGTLTLLWVVGVTNAYNFVDSMDGLASGLGGLAAAFYVFVTYDAQQIELSLFAAAILGACIGTFYFNSPPARFFLGDSGAQFIGFILAALAIAYNPVGFSRLASWYVPILLAGVPIFDMALVVLSRLRRRQPVYLAGLDHTYHRLVRLGMHPNRAVVSMHLMALLLGCLAFVALSLQPLWSNVVFGLCVAVGLSLVLYLDIPKR